MTVIKALPFANVQYQLHKWGDIRGKIAATAHVKPTIDAITAHDLRSIAETASLACLGESDHWQTITLNQNEATAKLRQLEPRLKDDRQKTLWSDTLRCLEAGAYRAAIVMAWSLAFDFIRLWVYSDQSSGGRLQLFNAQLTQRNRPDKQPYTAISTYEEFEELGEAFFLDLCRIAGLIPKTLHQTIAHALNRRNHYAHPTFMQATAGTAGNYIDDLITNVIESKAFDN